MRPIEPVTVTDYTTDGRCSGCGQCCSSALPLSRSEVARIRAYVKKHGIREQHRHGMQGIDLSCPFRDEASRKCLIYDVRPDICRAFQCNQPVDVIQARKRYYHATRRIVFMRAEFFGNTADLDEFSEYLRMAIALGLDINE